VVSVKTSQSRDGSRDVLAPRLGLGHMRLGSCLKAIRLGLGPIGLISGLGPLRLVETFCANAGDAEL